MDVAVATVLVDLRRHWLVGNPAGGLIKEGGTVTEPYDGQVAEGHSTGDRKRCSCEGRRRPSFIVGIQNRLGDTTLASGRKGTHWAYACKWASRCGDAGKEEERWGKAGKEEEER